MALAGFTCVGEFHYLHHGPDGAPYADPNAMGAALRGGRGRRRHPAHAARHLLPPRRHRRAELDDGAAALQRRRRRRLGRAGRRSSAESPTRAGSARRSTRCGRSTRRRSRSSPRGPPSGDAPLHAHVSRAAGRERAVPRRATAARRPSCWPQHGALGDRFTAVHATHLTAGDVALLGARGRRCCFCPTTERDLADGIGPAGALPRPGAALSPRHRLPRRDRPVRGGAGRRARRAPGHRRARHPPAGRAAGRGHGRRLRAASAGRTRGRIAVGALADLIDVGLDSVRARRHRRRPRCRRGRVRRDRGRRAPRRRRRARIVVRDGRHVSIDVAAELERVDRVRSTRRGR